VVRSASPSPLPQQNSLHVTAFQATGTESPAYVAGKTTTASPFSPSHTTSPSAQHSQPSSLNYQTQFESPLLAQSELPLAAASRFVSVTDEDDAPTVPTKSVPLISQPIASFASAAVVPDHLDAFTSDSPFQASSGAPVAASALDLSDTDAMTVEFPLEKEWLQDDIPDNEAADVVELDFSADSLSLDHVDASVLAVEGDFDLDEPVDGAPIAHDTPAAFTEAATMDQHEDIASVTESTEPVENHQSEMGFVPVALSEVSTADPVSIVSTDVTTSSLVVEAPSLANDDMLTEANLTAEADVTAADSSPADDLDVSMRVNESMWSEHGFLARALSLNDCVPATPPLPVPEPVYHVELLDVEAEEPAPVQQTGTRLVFDSPPESPRQSLPLTPAEVTIPIGGRVLSLRRNLTSPEQRPAPASPLLELGSKSSVMPASAAYKRRVEAAAGSAGSAGSAGTALTLSPPGPDTWWSSAERSERQNKTQHEHQRNQRHHESQPRLAAATTARTMTGSASAHILSHSNTASPARRPSTASTSATRKATDTLRPSSINRAERLKEPAAVAVASPLPAKIAAAHAKLASLKSPSLADLERGMRDLEATRSRLEETRRDRSTFSPSATAVSASSHNSRPAVHSNATSTHQSGLRVPEPISRRLFADEHTERFSSPSRSQLTNAVASTPPRSQRRTKSPTPFDISSPIPLAPMDSVPVNQRGSTGMPAHLDSASALSSDVPLSQRVERALNLAASLSADIANRMSTNGRVSLDGKRDAPGLFDTAFSPIQAARPTRHPLSLSDMHPSMPSLHDEIEESPYTPTNVSSEPLDERQFQRHSSLPLAALSPIGRGVGVFDSQWASPASAARTMLSDSPISTHAVTASPAPDLSSIVHLDVSRTEDCAPNQDEHELNESVDAFARLLGNGNNQYLLVAESSPPPAVRQRARPEASLVYHASIDHPPSHQ
jgi:hypothetical protein